MRLYSWSSQSQGKGQAWEFPGNGQQKLATTESLTLESRAEWLVPKSRALACVGHLALLGSGLGVAPPLAGHLLHPTATGH